MQSPLVGVFGFSPFATAAAPSGAMVVYAALYATVSLGVAVRVFSKRDL